MLYRMRADFQLTILTLFGACTVLLILPFAVYRFLIGATIVGVLDTTIALCICAAVVYAWRSGDTRRSGLFLVVINTVGTAAVAALLGAAGLFWMYTTLLANFFLVSRGVASIFTALSLLALALYGKPFETAPQMISFLITASLVSLFAFIFAARTESQRLQLETLATRDPLTGIDNRRAMEKELQIAVETHKRSQAVFGLVMLDLDHFKRVNDQFGHDAGDRVLIAFADLIRKSTRKVDRLFRFGGEEFVLLLPGADVVGLQRVTANLRNKIATELRGPTGPVTCSQGAAVLSPGEDWPSWLARTDAALYRAKDSGRNCAVVDGVEASDVP
ncbi:MAG: GGDEF domain-containing protein [Arenimonas sp.]